MLKHLFWLIFFGTNTLLLFCQTIPMAINGNAFYLGNDDCYRLTSENTFESGSIWALSQLDLSENFIVDFDFYLGDIDGNGADGLAFVLQQVSTSVGSAGGQIGFGGISPSLAIEFDTWNNGNYSDPYDDHIAIMQDGIVDHSTTNNLAGPIPILGYGINAEDGVYRNCRIEWDNASFTLDVYVDCILKISYVGDIVNDIFGNNPNVFYGFTSATGGSFNNHEVCINQFGSLALPAQTICQNEIAQLSYNPNYLSYSWSPANLVVNPNIAQTATTNLNQSVDFELTVTDSCGNTFVVDAPIWIDNCLPFDTCIQTTFLNEYELDEISKGFEFLANGTNGYYLLGSKADSIVIINHNANDQPIWLRSFKATNFPINFMDAIFDSDSNLVIVGGTELVGNQTESFAVKFNISTNTILWHKKNIDPDTNRFWEIKEKAIADNYIVAARTQSGNDADIVHLEMDRTTGDLVLESHYTLGSSEDIYNYQIFNNTIYGAGRFANGSGATNFRTSLTQFDLLGNEIFSKLYVTDLNNVGRSYGWNLAIIDSTIFISSYGSRNTTNLSDYTIQVINTDLLGNVITEYDYEITGVDRLRIRGSQHLQDGILIVGFYQDIQLKAFILKVDFLGNSLWAKGIDLGNQTDEFFDVNMYNGNVYAIGQSSNGNLLFVKLDENGNIINGCQTVEDLTIIDTPIPNPAESNVTLTNINYNIILTDETSNIASPVLNVLEICSDDCYDPIINNIFAIDTFLNCNDSCTQIIVSASGGLGPITFEWIENASGNNDTITVCPTINTTYSVVVSNTNEFQESVFDTLSVLIEKETCCPETINYNGQFEYCDSNLIDIIYEEQALINSTFLWSNNSDSSSTIANNQNCEPQILTSIVNSTCLQQPFTNYSDTFDFNIYPTNLELFYSENFTDCEIEIAVIDECLDFVAINNAPIINAGEEGSFEFIVEYLPNTNCVNNDTIVSFYDCPICDLDSVIIEGFCNGIDTSTFDIFISFTGSNLYTILDTDGNIYQTAITSGNNIYVGAFANLSEVTIIVRDEILENCQIAAFIECIICDPNDCYSEEGTISANEINPCFGELVIADADDFLLMPKQSIWYLIHNIPNVSADNLPDFNSDVYETGSFLNNNNETLPCGNTAYITAFGAQEDSNNPGFPNYNDICMTISNTLPINLLCPISIATDEICNVVTGQFTYSFILNGGMPPFSGENYFVSGNYFTGVAGFNELISVGPIADGETYIINVIDSEGCTNSFEATIQCEKLPIELIYFEGSTLSNANKLFWETATENQIDFFTLQKSENGIDFETIKTLKANGNSNNGALYSHLDNNIKIKDYYYKLLENTNDGTVIEHQTILLSRALNLIEKIKVKPNPFYDKLEIQITPDFGTQAKILINNALGEIVYSKEEFLFVGANNIQVNLTDKPTGVYFLKVFFDNDIFTKKLIKK